MYVYITEISFFDFSLLFCCSAASFTALDKNYLTPFFTSQNEDEENEGMFDLALISNYYYLTFCFLKCCFMRLTSLKS